MSEPWPGRVVDEPSNPQWPGRAAASNPRTPTMFGGNRALRGPVAVDGDTIRTPAERVRLWGVDAPELEQRGYDPQGRPVPIGQQSRDYLQGAISDTSSARLGDVQGSSYGRLVGPVTLDGNDAGLSAVRSGNAIAAPGFVRNDPDYRFKLMEAERLARLNRLGPMNDTYTIAPADYRKSPDWKPERETIAQFWDTPTPLQGMRPEAEKQYVDLLRNGTADDIYKFGTSQGMGMDPAEVKAWVADRDKRKAVGAPFEAFPNYQRGPDVIQQLGDGAMGAGVRKFGEGFVAGGLGELGAIADTFGATDGRENVFNSDRRLADIWANNEYQNEAILRGDAYAHPTASTVGEIAGGLTSGLVIPVGAGARTAGELGRVGLGYGALGGFLGTDGDVPDRLKGAALGAPVGMVLNAGLGKAIEAGAPLIGKGARKLFGKDIPEGTETAGEAVGAYADETAQNAAQVAPDAIPEDAWPGRVVGRGEGPLGSHGAAPDAVDSARVMAMEGERGASISAEPRQRDYLDLGPARPRPLLDPATAAEREAAAANLRPADVLPMPSNFVDGPEDAAAAQAGRFVEARAPNERAELSRGTVKNWMGRDVPKVGPVDMVGWLRLRGGLQDQGGELSHMGITNAARRGLDHVGQEARFGPLVNNESGMSLDDAALSAWEHGYFPELSDRPTVNEFLDALRETHVGGSGRRFHPDDMPELDRYAAAQADRYALEQQQYEAGGPIYADTSTVAPEGQPFPPVQAYEEWPADAVKRAGNINLDKLDSPQDIRRALVQTERRVGFDAATRGRVTQAETERLASELGMTADQLLSRRKGQALNAEEALAARQILAKSGNELVNAARRLQVLGDDPGAEALAAFRKAWVRHVAIQEQVSGMTAEAGRALQQFRMAADSREVRSDVLDAMVRGGGGKDRLQEAANVLLDAVEGGPGVFNTIAEKAAQPKFRDKLIELYINMLLSGPQTHAVNMASNTLTAIAQIPEHAAGAAIGGVRRLIAGQPVERVTAGELGARTFGLIQGAREGARLFAQALPPGEASDFASKVEGEQYKAISGLKGEAIRVPTRLLTAEDEFFKGIARRMELNAEAVRIAQKEGLRGEAYRQRIAELVANPTDEMFQRALDYGRYLTFQRKLGPFAQKVSALASTESAPGTVAKLFLPFVRTPTNLLKFAAERSPAAPLLKEWRADFSAGGSRRDMAVAKSMLGTAFGAAIYAGALNGVITGSAPTDKTKTRLLYADGWQPYSIKLGDQWFSYKRLDPFSTTLGVAADLATLPDGLNEKQREDKTTLLVASIMGNLASKTWLSGLSDLTEALTDPGRYAGDLKQRLVASFLVPNLATQIARVSDPIRRQREGVMQEVQSRIPGLSQVLLPQRDIWGEPIANGDNLGPDLLSPMWVSKQLDDPVNRALLPLDYAPGYPSKSVGGRELTPEEYDRYSALSGKTAHDALRSLVVSPVWRTLDGVAKVKSAKKAVAAAREGVRAELGLSGASVDDEGDAWPGKVISHPRSAPAEQWPGKPVASRDVMGDLERAIPGIQFTSGYRSPEYNASLRARGYHPAVNSEHLDGSALDMLPPPGKSLGWLMARVEQYDPKARLLVHDGHLHAGFNGYYSAPAIGGAKAARDRNPGRMLGGRR